MKLAAEAQKLGWDARFAPYLAIAAVIGGLLGAATFIARLMGHGDGTLEPTARISW